MKRLVFSVLCISTYLIYGLVISQYDPSVLPEDLRTESPAGYHDYRGITHVHTSISTGSQTPEEVIQQANAANINFLFLTEQNNFSLPQGPIGYYDNTLVIQAGEYGYLDSRLMFYDVHHKHDFKSLGQTQVLFADLLSQPKKDSDEGFLVLAHPFKRGFSWSGEYPPGLTGIEVLNFKSVWEAAWEASKASFIWSALIYPFNPRLALLRLYFEPHQELELWDNLNRKRPTVGLIGTDATARAFRIGPWTWRFPTYRAAFEMASNHLLLQSELIRETSNDSEKVFSALKKGQLYIGVDLLGDTRGFLAEMRDQKNRYTMGAQIPISPELKLLVQLPRKPRVPFEVVVFKDGSPYLSSNSQETLVNIHSSGIYRVVVRVTPTLPLPDRRRTFTWIYTNPFYVHN